MSLRVAMEVPRTQAEGPGHRYAIWVQGCTLRCPGCCNPEFFPAKGGHAVDIDALVARIGAQADIEGVSLLGGEPMQQARPVARLLARVRELGLSTMVFTGYTLAELGDIDGSSEVLAVTDLLVDGRYDRNRPDDTRRFIGSSNQSLHALTGRYDLADPVFSTPDTVEIRLSGGVVTINGRPWGSWKPRRRT